MRYGGGLLICPLGTWSGSRCTGQRPWTRPARPGRRTRPEPGHVHRVIVRADGIQGLVPGWQHLSGRRVEVPCRRPRPRPVARRRVADHVGGWPPDLVVGGADHLSQHRPGHRAADGHVQVRGQPLLGFDGAEVLRVVAEDAPQVLDESVGQGGEVQRVPRGPLVVIAVRVDGGAVVADLAVAVAGPGGALRVPRAGHQRRPRLGEGPGGAVPAPPSGRATINQAFPGVRIWGGWGCCLPRRVSVRGPRSLPPGRSLRSLLHAIGLHLPQTRSITREGAAPIEETGQSRSAVRGPVATMPGGTRYRVHPGPGRGSVAQPRRWCCRSRG